MRAEEKNVARIKDLLLAACGLQFAEERERTLNEALARRISARQVAGTAVYGDLLAADAKERQALIELLTVNETYFMREPEYLALLVEQLLPELLATKGDDPLEIFCAGCSTGEEPYSLAIMLDRRFGAAAARLFRIVAGDIDAGAIAVARQGIYSRASFRGRDDESWRQRYFQPHAGGGWQLSEEIRRRVQFVACNLLAADYPSAVEQPRVVFYRNVSIYFPAPVQREIFHRLAGLLAVGGCLMVGASETFHHDLGILPLVTQGGRYFFRKPADLAPERKTPAWRPGGVKTNRTASVAGVSSVSPSRWSGTPGSRLRSAALAPAQDAVKVAIERGPQSPVAAGNPATRRLFAQEAAAQAPAASSHPGAAADRAGEELFAEALQLARRRCFAQSRELLGRLVLLDCAPSRVHALEGCIMAELECFEEARQRGLAALEQDPLCLEAYLLLGISARQQAEHREAARRFREALYLDQTCWSAHFYLGETSWALGEYGRAQRAYRNALNALNALGDALGDAPGDAPSEIAALDVLQGSEGGRPASFFPLSYEPAHFISICRHKLARLAAGATEPGMVSHGL